MFNAFSTNGDMTSMFSYVLFCIAHVSGNNELLSVLYAPML